MTADKPHTGPSIVLRPSSSMSIATQVEKALKSANEQLGGITVPACRGDNLAIALCTYFDDGEDPVDGDTTWSESANEGYRQMISAIQEHYTDAIRSALTVDTTQPTNRAPKLDQYATEQKLAALEERLAKVERKLGEVRVWMQRISP